MSSQGGEGQVWWGSGKWAEEGKGTARQPGNVVNLRGSHPSPLPPRQVRRGRKAWKGNPNQVGKGRQGVHTGGHGGGHHQSTIRKGKEGRMSVMVITRRKGNWGKQEGTHHRIIKVNWNQTTHLPPRGNGAEQQGTGKEGHTSGTRQGWGGEGGWYRWQAQAQGRGPGKKAVQS